MATTSALRAMHDLHALVQDPPNGWSTFECAVEVLANALGAGPAASGTTLVPNLLGAAASATVPVGAKGYVITVMTGTATIAGVAAIPAGITFSSNRVVATAIVVLTAAASSAVVAWET
jgi:hypothetical protein